MILHNNTLVNVTQSNCTWSNCSLLNCTWSNCTIKEEDEWEYGHDLSPIFSNFMSTLFILIIVTSLFSNTILITTILLSRQLYSITHVFIVNLAIGDMITTMFVIPFDVNFMINGVYTHSLIPCAIMQTTFLMSLPLAVWNLFLLTVERFITISFPFMRDTIFTKRNVVIILLMTWCYILLASMFPMMYDKNALYVDSGFCELGFPTSYTIFHGVVNFVIPILGITILNFLIFRIAKAHEKRIQSAIRDAKKHQRKLLSFRKGAKRILLLVGVCVFCSLTFIIMVMWNILCDVCHPREVTWMVNAINYMSVSINPILYGVLNISIRNEIIKRFKTIFTNPNKRSRGRVPQFLEINGNSNNSNNSNNSKKMNSLLSPTDNGNQFVRRASSRSDIILPIILDT